MRLPRRIAAIAGVLWGVALAAPASGADESYGRRQFVPQVRGHWAFQSVTRPEVPSLAGNGWAGNPIDAFVLSRLHEAGLKPSGPAERRVLLRRVYLDLIGLPPTP